MKRIKIVFAVCLLALMSFSNKSAVDDDCSILHKGTFKYTAQKDEVKVVIDGESHTEYHNGGKYIIESKLVWGNDCEYTMSIVKVTIPNFPFKVGDTMHVKVDRVDGKTIYYTSAIKGQTWQGVLQKIK